MGSDYVISTKNQKYEASQIQCIYMNYERIGIKLHGKRLVLSNSNVDLCVCLIKTDYEREILYFWGTSDENT